MSTVYRPDDVTDQKQEPAETVHIYIVRESLEETLDFVEADPPLPSPRQRGTVPSVISRIVLFALLALLMVGLSGSAAVLTTTVSNTFTLTLSVRPTASQVRLYQLPAISAERQVTVAATGIVHRDATRATGLITFYNGAFTVQVVPVDTSLTGKDGVMVVTQEAATIPAALPTTPPTYGTVSVMAVSSVPGAAGNIAASDIDQACCGVSILAQNLYPFTGGKDAQSVTVVQKSDITGAAAGLSASLDQDTHDRAAQEQPAGEQLVPLSCTASTHADHTAGDQAVRVTVSVAERCVPLAYSLAEVQQQAAAFIRPLVPRSATILDVTVLLLAVSTTDTATGSGILTIAVSAQVEQVLS
jgi:hypothetical protein